MITPKQLAASDTEDGHQAALFCWCALNIKLYPELKWLFAIPNGGKRDARTAGKLKATGVKSGVPDMFLPVCMQHRTGLWIELKRPVTEYQRAGQISNEQLEWLNHLTKEGYAVRVCYGWEEARDALIQYLGMR